METLTPTQLAVQLWGQAENDSHSQGAREVRRIARDLFPKHAPGMGGKWALTPDQAAAIHSQVVA